jgi:hypothetical protein
MVKVSYRIKFDLGWIKRVMATSYVDCYRDH